MTTVNESSNKNIRKDEWSGPLVELFKNSSGKPWITYSVIAVCVAIWAYFNLSQESSIYQRLAELLIPSSVIIWSGAYWSLFTSAFVHFNIWHILFNMWWLKDFGKLLEPTMRRSKYVFFIITAAIVSSGAELAVADQTGIGFSGVVYAMFGYLLAARHVQPLYQKVITKQTIIWLLGWLVLCVILTYTHVWQVANAAHIAGFMFGYCVGNVFAARVRVTLSKVALSVLFALTVLSVIYLPWSETWRNRDEYAQIIAIGDEAAAGNPESQYKYANILTEYGMKAEAVSWLRKSASQNYVPAMNALAWTLATDRDDALRDGAEAVRLAEKACQQDNWKEPQYVDTLAAAYAEVGKFSEAIRLMHEAIEKTDINKEPEIYNELKLHLERFENKQPWRE